MSADADDEHLPRLGREAAAFDALYARHATPLLAYAFAHFPRIAEDLCQNAWRKALLRPWTARDNLRAWLFRVVKNDGISEMRKPKTNPLPPIDPPSRPVVDDAEDRETLRQCLERLRDANPGFHAVVQAFLEGEAPATAAARLGISRDNYDQRKKRAVQSLADCASGKDGGL